MAQDLEVEEVMFTKLRPPVSLTEDCEYVSFSNSYLSSNGQGPHDEVLKKCDDVSVSSSCLIRKDVMISTGQGGQIKILKAREHYDDVTLPDPFLSLSSGALQVPDLIP